MSSHRVWFARGIVLVTIALVFALLYLAGRQSAPTATVLPASVDASRTSVVVSATTMVAPMPARIATAAPQAIAGPTVASILARHHGDLVGGFNEAIASFGARDPQLLSAIAEAAAACSSATEQATAEPTDEAQGIAQLTGELRDPHTAWALDALVKACAGFDPARFAAQLDRAGIEDPINALTKGGVAAQLASAHRVVASGQDRFALANAGRALILDDEAWLAAMFPAGAPAAKHSLVADWILATALAGCGSQLGCGPESMSTLAYCADSGCLRGVDLRQALQASLPPRDFQAVLTFSDWLQRRR